MLRRTLLQAAPASLLALGTSTRAEPARLHRSFPRSHEPVPAIGMGTWLTFDVGDEPMQRAQRREVLRRFFAAGGGVIDSSPMYGRAEGLLGELLPDVEHAGRLFTSTKVSTAPSTAAFSSMR